ncbi:MAG: hypothetical protein AAF517_24145, partial [Planctomycetota bacterium]
MLHRSVLALALAFTLVSVTSSAGPRPERVIEQYREDLRSIQSYYLFRYSDKTIQRLESFLAESAKRVDAVGFEGLSVEDRVDLILLRKHITYTTRELARRKGLAGRVQTILPFASELVELEENRWRGKTDAPALAAEKLARLKRRVTEATDAIHRDADKRKAEKKETDAKLVATG